MAISAPKYPRHLFFSTAFLLIETNGNFQYNELPHEPEPEFFAATLQGPQGR
jgi:hypothetical protein